MCLTDFRYGIWWLRRHLTLLALRLGYLNWQRGLASHQNIRGKK